MSTQSNLDKFRAALEIAYTDLFANNPEYAFSAARTTPKSLAAKATSCLVTGDFNKSGAGIARACKACGIKQTYKAISQFLQA